MPEVRFGTLVAKDSPLYGAFKLYKNDYGESGTPHRKALAAILAFAYEEHEADLEAALGGPPTLVAAVPSTKPYNVLHPLRTVVDSVAALRELLAVPLVYTDVKRDPHTVQRGLFKASTSLTGSRAILIEDLWVRGGTATTAVQAIEDVGGRAVVLAIGREVRRDFLSCEALLKEAGKPLWYPNR